MHKLAFVLATGLVLAVAPSAGGGTKPRCLGVPATIVGTPGDDVLVGTHHRDVIVGLGGDDTIEGGGGRDRICGGVGIDTLSFAGSEEGEQASLATGVAGADAIEGIENLFGSPFADVLVGDAGSNTVEGSGGDDVLDGAGGTDVVSYEHFAGKQGTSTLIGIGLSLAGGFANNDGTDTLLGFEDVLGSAYADVLGGDDGANVLRGGDGDDSLRGLGGNDELRGGTGLDGLFADPGDDLMDGGPGNDSALFALVPGPIVYEAVTGLATGAGTDRVESVTLVAGTPGDDDLFANHADAPSLSGGPGDDLLQGYERNDALSGDAGDDILRGGAGSNLLHGGPGTDECTDYEVGESCERVGVGALRLEASFVDTTDPAISFTTQGWQLQSATCMRLVAPADADGAAGTTLVPDAATALPERSADGRVFTFTVRRGLMFSNGAALTAQTFKDTVERANSSVLGGPARAYLRDLVAIDVAGDRISFTLSASRGDFPQRIAIPFFCAVPSGTPLTQTELLPSAGPYTFTALGPGGATLARNPTYRGRRSSVFDRIEIATGNSFQQQRIRVETGLADLTEVGGGEAGYVSASYGGTDRYVVRPTIGFRYVGTNTSRAPLTDGRLRRAIATALDRNVLLAFAGADAGTATDQLLTPPFPSFTDVSIFPLGGDLAAAAALAASAGVTPTSRVALTLYTSASPVQVAHAGAVRAQLAPLGIDVTVQAYPFGELLQRLGASGEPYDLYSLGWVADYTDPAAILESLLHSAGIGPNGPNYAKVADVDSSLEAAAVLEGQARVDAYRNLDHDLSARAALIPISTINARWFLSSRMGCTRFSTFLLLNALCTH